MKFLSKKDDSEVLARDVRYTNRAENNRELLRLLKLEQRNFCAYTEKFIEELDSCEVEHFDSSKKINDNYYNYYAVLRSANLIKKDEQYVGSSFFTNLFFQDSDSFNLRIQYDSGLYQEVDPNDQEAKDLIDFLGFNHNTLSTQRSRHIRRVKNHFAEANFNDENRIEYFRDNNEELSFVTALEIELGIDLSEFYR